MGKKIVKCKHCGKDVEKYQSIINRTQYSFCSRTCRASYRRRTLKERFMDKVIIKEDGCWQWNACTCTSGFPQIKSGYKILRANRVSYELFVGPIPEGMLVRTKCMNRLCVNPHHLILIPSKHRSLLVSYGEKTGNSKLNEKQVIEIRKEYSKKKISQTELAARYKVKSSTIHCVVKRKTWTHLKP